MEERHDSDKQSQILTMKWKDFTLVVVGFLVSYSRVSLDHPNDGSQVTGSRDGLPLTHKRSMGPKEPDSSFSIT